MKTLLITLLGTLLLSSCAMFGPKPKVAHHRPDIKTKINKLIIFPTTNFSGEVTEGAKSVNTSIISSWGNMYGTEKVIPAGPVIEKLVSKMGKDAYMKIVKSLDNMSLVEQLHKNAKIRKFISAITSKFGNYNFALALISGGEKEYDGKKPVNLNIGMFDTENLTWKWITKIETTKGLFGNWMAASGSMVSNSFNRIEELEQIKK